MRAKERAYWQAYVRDRVKIDPVTGCWEWQLHCNVQRGGYGQVSARHGVETRAHRLAYTAFKGPIPEGMQVRHQCHNTPCCNPKHLLVGTDVENKADSRRDGREPPANRILTVQQVHEVRHLLAQGVLSQSAIGAQFGLCQTAISKIKRGKYWRNV